TSLVKFDPVIVTCVPPVDGPVLGLTPVTAGGDCATKVNWSLALVALVPAAVVTVMSTAPAALGGATAISCDPAVVNDVAAAPPNAAEVAPPRFVPVMVTLVPPVVGPVFGLTAVTVGMEPPAV